MDSGELKTLEERFLNDPNLMTICKLIDAYVDRRDARSLEKALSLVLNNLNRYEKESRFLDRATKLLVLIKDNAEASKMAVELTKCLLQLEPDQIKWYVNAAYTYWRLGNIAAAIESSEFALRKFENVDQTDEYVLALKGNLAYYYAERAVEIDRDSAFRLATDAYQAKPTASRADNLGYVFLRFARNREDLEQAHHWFTAAKKGLEELRVLNPLVTQHLDLVKKKLEAADHIDKGVENS